MGNELKRNAMAENALLLPAQEESAVVCKDGAQLRVMLTFSRRIAVTHSVTAVVLRQFQQFCGRSG